MYKYILILFFALGNIAPRILIAQEKPITVGGKFFTEQYILAEITKQILEKNGFTVSAKVGLGSNLLRKSHELGEVDLYWEYTGTSLIAYNKVEGSFGKQETYSKVKQLDAEKGIIWLAPADANNTFCIMMNRDDAEKLGIVSISDFLSRISEEKFKLAVTAEFLGRPDGVKGLEKAYDTRISRRFMKSMEDGLIYSALKNNQVDAGIGFATDGRISAYNFITLTDDKNFFPDYSLAAVVRDKVLAKYPEIEPLMESVAAKLNDAVLQNLNSAVDIRKKSAASAAAEFISENNL